MMIIITNLLVPYHSYRYWYVPNKLPSKKINGINMVVEMVQNSTFQDFIHIPHLFIEYSRFVCILSMNIYSLSTFIFIQNLTPIFMFKSCICSQHYCPFRNVLSIQQFSNDSFNLSYAWKCKRS